MTYSTQFKQTPDYWESNPSATIKVDVEIIPQSFLRGMDDYSNGRVTEMPDWF